MAESPDMTMEEIRPGLIHWTSPHPDWTPAKDKPGGWGQMVRSIFYEPPTSCGATLILIDPLTPSWEWLDRTLTRARLPITILLGNHYHVRSAMEIYERYVARVGATIWAHAETKKRLGINTIQTFSRNVVLDGGVKAHVIPGLDSGEVIYAIPQHRALVAADALIGVGHGRIRVPPMSWATNTPEGEERYKKEFRATLRSLTELPIEMILVSHGPAVLSGGRMALAEALEAPAWGEERTA